MEKQEKTEEKSEGYQVVKVPTGEALAIQTPSEELINNEQAIVEILNGIADLKKAIVGTGE